MNRKTIYVLGNDNKTLLDNLFESREMIVSVNGGSYDFHAVFIGISDPQEIRDERAIVVMIDKDSPKPRNRFIYIKNRNLNTFCTRVFGAVAQCPVRNYIY